jgi:hypothetical protein
MFSIKNLFKPDNLEKDIVFKVSRVFFWIFTGVGLLTFIVSIFVLLYTIIPSIKGNAEIQTLPKEPEITFNDILKEITPVEYVETKETEKLKSKTTLDNQEVSKNYFDPLETKFNSLLDSLKKFFPDKWEPIYRSYELGRDFYGRVTGYGQYLAEEGMKTIVIRFLTRYDSKDKQIGVLQDIIQIIEKIDSAKREKAFYAYFNVVERKWNDYQNAVDQIQYQNAMNVQEVEMEYTASVAKKVSLRELAKYGLAGAIVLVALFGLILAFLAIERNTRAIKQLIESRGTNV